MVHIFILCISNSLYSCTPVILHKSCEMYPQLDENIWGVYAYVGYHMQLMHIVEYDI